jgi:serine/threonine protein kinase
MNETAHTAEAIFAEAIEIAMPADRVAFLERVCEGDASLREAVEKLVDDHFRAGSFLESPAFDFTATAVLSAITEGPGTVIGPYKLLQQLGEGGMGVVFMAEQTEPIRRTVALKIIKPGMDTRRVIARFEAERQALAMMDHPNIAKVLDAGTTETGRAYFVMELVKGVPITTYCDEKQFSLRQRLELFKPVCKAVQHAHQKGIIHRDIKPTNVVVAEYDNRAVPKVIDFGVAKATAQKLTERTMFTEFGQVIGTVEYMSPEQAKFNQLDIDTRSDIYSLGVLLYELLIGSTPFERQRLREAAFDEMLRIIREEEPPKPSTKLSLSDMLPSIAANRDIDPAHLRKQVRGELDWIVMKALEKDRTRRYETASGFAADIERHLKDEPVEASPPSATYRLRKFARRYRGPLAAAALAMIALFAATVFSSWQAVRVTQQLHLFSCLYLAVLVVVSLVTRATARRIAGALAGSITVGMAALGIIALGERVGWWDMAISWEPYFLALLLINITLCAWVFLITWRIARRFGWRGLAIVMIAAAILGPPRQYWYLQRFPEWGAYAPGMAPVLAISATYVLLGILGHSVMRLVAGPSRADPLAHWEGSRIGRD